MYKLCIFAKRGFGAGDNKPFPHHAWGFGERCFRGVWREYPNARMISTMYSLQGGLP